MNLIKPKHYWVRKESENENATFYVVHTKNSSGLFSGPNNESYRAQVDQVRKYIPNAVIREFKDYGAAFSAVKNTFRNTQHKPLKGQVSIEVVEKTSDFLDIYSKNRKWVVLFLNDEPFIIPNESAVKKLANRFLKAEYVVCDDYETAILVAKADNYRNLMNYSLKTLKKLYDTKKINFWKQSLVIDFRRQSFYGLSTSLKTQATQAPRLKAKALF